MVSVGFLLVTVSLCWTTAYCAVQPTIKVDSRYNSSLQALVEILWKTFTTEIRNKENVLLFALPYVPDMSFIDRVLGEEAKKQVRKTLPLYDKFENDVKLVDEEFMRLSSNETRFKTIFYGTLPALNQRMLYAFIYNKIAVPNDRFLLVSVSRDDDLDILFRLSEALEVGSIGATCEVRYCPVRQIFSSKASFAIITLATWNVTSLPGFRWIDVSRFALSETASTQVKVVRSYWNHDYAEFTYPLRNDCTGRVLRVPYRSDFTLFFVVPSPEKRCPSSEDLWKNVQIVNLSALKFKRQTMFVSIPIFKVSANIDLRMKLKDTPLAQAFDQPLSRLYNTLAFQTAEVIFSPQVPANWPIPAISGDVPSFWVERPFFFALFHVTSRAPIFAGLINNPECIKKCSEIEIE